MVAHVKMLREACKRRGAGRILTKEVAQIEIIPDSMEPYKIENRANLSYVH